MKRYCRDWTLCIAIIIAIQGALYAADPAYTVGFHKVVTILIPGATAAYAVDTEIAEASANQGVVTVVGKSPGSTHLVVVTPNGVQSFEIVVPMPPPIYPKGWVAPQSEGMLYELASYQTSYSSSPEQLTNILDFSRQGTITYTHFYLATTDFLPSSSSYAGSGISPFAVTSFSYMVRTKQRSVTLVDQYVDESPITVDGAIVRGLHWQEGDWFFHGGYTSPSPFEGYFLPITPEGVFGTGYRFRLTEHSRLTPSFYYLTMPATNSAGTPGAIYSVLYTFKPNDKLHFEAEIGGSHGLAGSSTVSYYGNAQSLHARFRYTPEKFATLSMGNLHGLYSDAAWTRQWSQRFGSDLNFTDYRYDLPTFKEVTVDGGALLRYRVQKQWTLFGGATYSLFHALSPGQSPIKGIYYPEGAGFNTHHFGASFQYQWSRLTGQSTAGHQYSASANTSFGQFSLNGNAQRETQALTLGSLVSQVSGLAQLLNQYGVAATSPQQISSFINQHAALINLNYVSDVSVNRTPLLEQVGGSATWNGRGYAPQVNYSFLINKDITATQDTQVTIHQLRFTERLGLSNDLSFNLSLARASSTGTPAAITPLITFSLRHRFSSAPAFLMMEHHGTIQGRVFEDQEGQGVHSPAAPGVAGVELILDNLRRTRSGSDGSYRFPGIPEGKHTIEAVLGRGTSYYFTTPAQAETSETGEIYFGVARTLSSLGGDVLNDASHGIPGIVVVIQGENRRLTALTLSDGKFLFPGLPEGEYMASVDVNSLPAGYLVDNPSEVHVVTSVGKAPRASLKIRALRNVSGRVLSYDPGQGRYVGIPGVTVVFEEMAIRSRTDSEGRFLFRELPNGTFTITAEYQGKAIRRQVTVPEQPAQLTGVDLLLGKIIQAKGDGMK